MKNYLLIIIILLISIILSLLIFKQEKSIIVNNYQYPFYKDYLQDEYLKYQQEHHLSYKDAIIRVNIGLNKPFYTNTHEALNQNKLTILVNKYHYLDQNYIPNDLIELNKFSKPNLKLNKEAYDNFMIMANDALKENLNLRIVSAYRSYEYQKNLYSNYLKKEKQEIVDTYSARAGFSEHQTGLAIDIDNIYINYNRFHVTLEYTWMIKNAYKYGFILRYPLGKEDITGYKYEPWHYRYVGKKIATYCHNMQITYEEYFYEFLDN